MKQANDAGSIEQARQDLNARFRGLTTSEIRSIIEQEFIASGKIRLVTDRNNNVVAVAEGGTSQAKARTLRLYNYALKQQKLSAASEAIAPKRAKPPVKSEAEPAAEPAPEPAAVSDIEATALQVAPSDVSTLYQLLLMPELEAGDTDGAIERLALFELALQEAGRDREEVELVIAQLFRQGLIQRRDGSVGDGGAVLPEYFVVTPEVELWHDKAVLVNKSLSDITDEGDGFPILDADLPTKTKNHKWFQVRPGFKRHR